jgi:hypothetical protein
MPWTLAAVEHGKPPLYNHQNSCNQGGTNKRGHDSKANGNWCEYHKRSGHDVNEYRTYVTETAKIMERGPMGQQPKSHPEIQPFKTIVPAPILLLPRREYVLEEWTCHSRILPITSPSSLEAPLQAEGPKGKGRNMQVK